MLKKITDKTHLVELDGRTHTAFGEWSADGGFSVFRVCDRYGNTEYKLAYGVVTQRVSTHDTLADVRTAISFIRARDRQ